MKIFLRILLVCCGICLQIPVLSQTLTYYYDETGNRTEKVIILQKSTSVSPHEKEVIQEKEVAPVGFKVLLYPNPNDGVLKVEIGPDESNEDKVALIKIEVFDLSGRVVINTSGQIGLTLVDLSGQVNGTYIMILTYGEKVSKWKIIKR